MSALSSKGTGGPAFPRRSDVGLTKLEWVATQVATGLVTRTDYKLRDENSHRMVAERSVKIARVILNLTARAYP